MSGARLLTAVIVLLLAPVVTNAGVLTISGGIGTQIQTNRDDDSRRDLVLLVVAPQYRDTFWDVRLDLALRWDVDTGTFLSEDWEREGDWLRPLEKAAFTSRRRDWSISMEIIDSYTVGSGNLVRSLTGAGEVDYALPGIIAAWTDGRVSADAMVDSVIDPSLAAASIRWQAAERLVVDLEGARDPEAPLSFNGEFSNGRPVTQETKSLSGAAAQVQVTARDGDLLDLSLYVRAGTLGDEASGAGGGVGIGLDFSRFYTSRISLKGGVMRCENGYIPSYFDGIYPIWRWGVSGKAPAADLRDRADDGPRDLGFLDLRYDLGGYFIIDGGYERFDDDSMKRARLRLSVNEGAGRGLEALIWSRAEADQELFDQDRNLYSRISALYNFLPHLMVRADYLHSWAFREDASALVPVTSFLVGALYTLSL